MVGIAGALLFIFHRNARIGSVDSVFSSKNRSLQHSEVFDRINLKRINRIGLILIGVGILSSAVQTVNILMAQGMVDLSNYSFTFSKATDFQPIIMGVVILIMNEVLRIGIEIKEEQDLTI